MLKYGPEKVRHNRTRKIMLKELSADKLLTQLSTFDKIIQIANDYISNNRSFADTYCEIATFLLNTGQAELALTYYRKSMALSLVPSTYSLYLQCLLMSPSVTEQDLYNESAKYSRLFLQATEKYADLFTELTLNKKLNIGYICHFFHNSVSQSMLTPFLQAHNRDRVTVYCYSDAHPDEVPDAIKSVADVWRDTKELDDLTLASIIRDDKIDVLLELNGHCVVNRYGVMLKKPAPIQVNYYNLSATSGISTIDYILVSNNANLNNIKDCYTESIYPINRIAAAVQFSDIFPPCAPPPCLKNNYITFGSFGAAHKVNTSVIKLWCKVLKQIPNSRFYMKAGVLTNTTNFEAYLNLFEAEGINLGRVKLEGFSDHRTMLEYYSKMDIALDTFPGQGGTTTLEALWQGVPVLSLFYGERYSTQSGKMILSSIGHPELIACSEDEFLQKACALAANPEQILAYRKQLRDDFKHSPLADPTGFAASLEDAYQDMWQIYYKSQMLDTHK